ncbi:FixH family protein [Flavobacterium sp. W21_SRS_FM6]|uniref:FixH family protein n=1 Tax=Flavobacterium sp. W21_SRS_FM6 TaxID=3240268 RepID=UPI003F908882
MQQHAEKQAWYKQFWPWFLIVIPLSSMVLSFTMMNFAFNSEDSLVKDDYYKEGRSINLDIHKIQEAKVRQIEAHVVFSDTNVVLELVSGNVDDGAALTMDFFHSTQQFKDFKTVLLKDAAGQYKGEIEHPLQGKWRISLHPYDELWKIQQVVHLPQSTPVVLKPE